MPIEVKPICTSWYENFQRGEYYFANAWIAFVAAYASAFFLRYAHKITWMGERWFEIPTLVNFQKLAALLMMQAPIVILPLSLDAERMAGIFLKNDQSFTISMLLSAVSFSVLSLFHYLTILRSSQNFKLVREKVLQNPSDTISSEATVEDVENHGPYYAAFCLQYTPREYAHEERAVWRKILWIFGTKMIQVFAVVLANKGEIENLACVRTAASSAVIVAVNLWYVRHLLRRPYISHRASSKIGDPMNDAEILMTRSVSMAAALLSIRDTLATRTASGESTAYWFKKNVWFMDVFCILVLIAVVHSNLRLFSGVDQDIRRTVSRLLSKVRSSSMRDSDMTSSEEDEAQARDRAHTGVNESVYGQIEKMILDESHRQIIKLQSELHVETMPAEEASRWSYNEERSSKWTGCRRFFGALIYVLFGVGLLFGLLSSTGTPSTLTAEAAYRDMSDAEYKSTVRNEMITSTWIMTLLPSLLYMIMEILVWRAKRRWATVAVEDVNTQGETVSTIVKKLEAQQHPQQL